MIDRRENVDDKEEVYQSLLFGSLKDQIQVLLSNRLKRPFIRRVAVGYSEVETIYNTIVRHVY